MSWKKSNRVACLFVFLMILIVISLLIAFLVYQDVGYIYHEPVINVYKLPHINYTYSFEIRCDVLYKIDLLSPCDVHQFIANPIRSSSCIVAPYIRGIIRCPTGYISEAYPEIDATLYFNRAMFTFVISLILAVIFLVIIVVVWVKVYCFNPREILEDETITYNKIV